MENTNKTCIICNKKLNCDQKTYCSRSCRGLPERKIKRPDYENLLNELSQSNFVQVGKKYGVSDNAVRKWLKYYQKQLSI